MLFYRVEDFVHHLKQAYPSHFCRVYLIIIEDDIERKTLINNTYFFLQKKGVGFKRAALDEKAEQIFNDMKTPSFFSKEMAVCIDPLEEFLSKEKLAAQLRFSWGYILLGCRQKKRLGKLFSSIEKYGVILDLQKEKPQERKKRHCLSLKKLARKYEMQVSDEAFSALLNQFENYETLKSEFLKLATYKMDKKKIEKQDVQALTHSGEKDVLWEIAEKLVWDRQACKIEKNIDSQFFHRLIHAMRYQLQMGLNLIYLDKEDWKNFYPYLWPKTLEMKKLKAEKYTKQYFASRLAMVYKIETMAKNNVSQYLAMLTFLFSNF